MAFVKDVIPLDPKRPRIIKLAVESAFKSAVEYTEFDTEESAYDWRRELIGTPLTFLFDVNSDLLFKVSFLTTATFARKSTPHRRLTQKASV